MSHHSETKSKEKLYGGAYLLEVTRDSTGQIVTEIIDVAQGTVHFRSTNVALSNAAALEVLEYGRRLFVSGMDTGEANRSRDILDLLGGVRRA